MLTPCTTQNDENSHAYCSNSAPETAGGYNPNRMARAAQQLRSCDKPAPSGPSVQRLAECSAQPGHPTSITSAGAERLAFVHERLARQGYLPSRAIRRGMRRLAKLGGKIRERSSFPDSVRLPPRESQALEAACPASVSSSPRDPRRSQESSCVGPKMYTCSSAKPQRRQWSKRRQMSQCRDLASLVGARSIKRGFGSIIGEKCRFSQGNSVRHHADHGIVAAFQGDGCGWP